MVRRLFTHLILVLGVLSFTGLKAQQVKFAFSPSTVTAAVGDTVSFNVVVTNFTNITSLQIQADWDPALLDTIKAPMVDKVTLPNPNGLGFSPDRTGNLIRFSWIPGGSTGTVTNGQAIFRLRLKVKVASTNLWVRFLTNSEPSSDLEVTQSGSGTSPSFYNVGIPPGTLYTPIIAKTSSHSVPVSQSVCVGVTADNFTNLESAKWQMKWDSSVLQYESVTKFNTTLAINATHFVSTQALANGRLDFAWTTPSAKTVPNGDTLYKVCFKAIGATSTSTQIQTISNTSEIYRNSSGSRTGIVLTPQNGSVVVGASGPPSTALTFAATTEETKVGDTVCVRVYVKNFTNISIGTLGMRWDSTKLSLTKVRLRATQLGLDSLILSTAIPVTCPGGPCYSSTASAFNYRQTQTGTLRVLFDFSSSPASLVGDSTLLFDLCFKVEAGTNTTTKLTFNNIPATDIVRAFKIQVLNGNDPPVELIPVFKEGVINIGANAAPIVSSGTTTAVNCTGAATGGIALTVSGGTGTFAYSWTGPNGFTSTLEDISSLKAGQYTVSITSGGATPKVENFIITEPTTALTSSTVITNVNCFGQATGSVVLNPSGGTAPYTYLWSSGETVKDLINNKAAATYTVTITDAKTCTKIETAAITQPTAALNATSNVTNVTCNGADNGAISLTTTGGTAPYTYAWVGTNSTTSAITGLFGAGYSVTITDSKNCALTLGPIQVTEPAGMTITPTVTDATCGTASGAININVTGAAAPLSYKWTGPSSFTSTSQNLTGLAVGAYTLEVTDNNGCKKTRAISVSTTQRTFSVTFSKTNVTCNGGTNGAIDLSITGTSGTLSYQWASTNYSATTQNIANLKAGSYNLTVSEAGSSCQVIPSAITIAEPTVIDIATPRVVDVLCKGEATGEITLTVSGGTSPYTYAWTGPNGFTALNTRAIGTLKAGTYNVTVTDASGCTKISSAEVKEPTGNALAIGTPSVTNVKCNGALTGAIAISTIGGTSPYTYSWTGSNSFTSASQNPNALAAGTYKVTTTDANGCKAISSDITVSQANALVVSGSITNAVSACNGKIDITATGGTSPYSYAWVGKDVSANSEDQINLCPNEIYTVTVTDASGCTVSRPFAVTGTIAAPITLNDAAVVSQAGCPGQNNGAINIDFAGGKAPFSFEWVNANGLTVGREKNISRLAAGKYRIKIADAVNQTFSSTEIEIKESASTISIVTASTKPQSCGAKDGEVRIDVSGGVIPYKYIWNTGDISKDLLNINEGKYSVTVMDNNNCLGDRKDMVVPRNLCPLTVTPSVKTVNCYNDKASVTINIQNGEPGYVISWGTNQSVRINNTPLRDGSYEIKDLAAGTYVFTVTDAKEQVTTANITITQPDELKIGKVVSADTGNCSGSIVLAVTGGNPLYSYVWNDGGTSRDRFNLCKDQVLSVTVRDSKGCFVSTPNDVIKSDVRVLVLNSTANITKVACPDDATGAIDINLQGGIKPYKFAWSNNTTGEDPASLKIGTYTVTVTDNTLPTPQRVIGTYTVGSTSTLKIKDLVTTTSAATVTIEGGEAPYTILWCNGVSQNSSNLVVSQSNLPAGTCGVTVTDSKGCKVSRVFDITATCAAVVPNSILPGGYNLPCATSKGAATVQTVTDQSLTPPYLFRWDNGESGNTALQLTAGARTLTVVGNNGKTCIANFVMRAPAEMKTVVTKNPSGVDCSLEATVTGGIAPYKYKWSTAKGDTTARVKDLEGGKTYSVFVKDINGCEPDPSIGEAVCFTSCLKGPSILTPNDDARNDKFDIQKCDFKNIRLQVYNRWGQLVYSSENYNDTWEGFSQDGKVGKELPEGVYMFVLKGIEPNGKELTTKGTVNLLRQ
jgi:gliding motility-associated-like protein